MTEKLRHNLLFITAAVALIGTIGGGVLAVKKRYARVNQVTSLFLSAQFAPYSCSHCGSAAMQLGFRSMK